MRGLAWYEREVPKAEATLAKHLAEHDDPDASETAKRYLAAEISFLGREIEMLREKWEDLKND